MQEWALAYEAPLSLDAARLIGAHSRRATLWTFAAIGGTFAVALVGVGLYVWLGIFQPFLAPPVGLWWVICYALAQPLAYRTPEYWFGVTLRHHRLPRVLADHDLRTHHLPADVPRAVIEVVQTVNLRMAEDDSLGAHVRKLCNLYNGLRFPIQIVVRSWQRADRIERRWFIAFTAPTTELLDENAQAIEAALQRADLAGHRLNGDLFDTLQACWSVKPRQDTLGPRAIERHRDHVLVDGEYVRGLLLAKPPRTTEANWLVAVLDGDLPVDCSFWFEPLDNGQELDELAGRISDWQTKQILNVNSGRGQDPDIDDQIKDAARTRLLLRRRQLRVFRTTIGFVVRGRTLDELHRCEQQLVDLLAEQVGDERPVVPADFEQDRAPLMAVPLGLCAVPFPLRMVTPALARMHPFSNSSLSMPGGVSCGTSVGSNRECRLNLFRPFTHAVVLGTTDAGKSFWVKCYVYRLLNAGLGIGCTIIQAERDEYSGLVRALGPMRGRVITVRSLNELRAHEDQPGLIFEHSGALREWRMCVLYDLTRMPQEQRGTAIAFLLQAVEKTAAWVRTPEYGVVVIDELGIVIDNAEAAHAIDMAYRRFRSIPSTHAGEDGINRRTMIGVSQRPSDLLRHPHGKVIADLAGTSVYLRQKSSEIVEVRGKLNLSNDEAAFIDGAEQGTGLLVAGGARVGFHLYATDDEKALGRT